jgi:mono/diheme cytochrome c family protein
MKQHIFLVMAASFLMSFNSCSERGDSGASKADKFKSESSGTSDYDPNRGLGKHTEENLAIGALDVAKADAGEKISGVKCASCHKYTEDRLVGPGFAGVTQRRTPHWIMNFITNPDPMIDVDPELQAQLELCLVRMPNQGLSDDDARNVLEFMRKNDGAQ